MQLTRLELKNTGPFLAEDLTFQTREEGPGVTILTGENGTGKRRRERQAVDPPASFRWFGELRPSQSASFNMV